MWRSLWNNNYVARACVTGLVYLQMHARQFASGIAHIQYALAVIINNNIVREQKHQNEGIDLCLDAGDTFELCFPLPSQQYDGARKDDKCRPL